MFLLSTVFYLL